jgi:phosphatidylinositol glycan class W
LLFFSSQLLFVLRHSICSSYQTGDHFTPHICDLFIYQKLISFIFDATVTPTKKNDHDNAVLGSKELGNYMATLTVDFLFIVLPMLLIFTVSFLNQEIVIFAFNNYFLFSF